MRRASLTLLLTVLAFAPTQARADIPTIDAAQLDQHANTSAAKVKLVPVVTDHATSRRGIHCATTKGRKGSVLNTAAPANTAAGQSAVQSSAPGAPTAVASGATGADLAAQYQGSQTAGVAADVAGGQQTVANGSAALTQQGASVGTSQTVMAAWDANSIARAQQGTTFNNVISAVTALAQAYNLANLASVELASRSGASLTYPTPTTGGSLCPSGATGMGTSSNPCAVKSSNCTKASATCVVQRAIDSYGNVIYYLASLQAPPTSQPATR